MDPQKALLAGLKALHLCNSKEAAEHFANLSEWLSKNGFCPSPYAAFEEFLPWIDSDEACEELAKDP